jgi:hypothetical protein
MLYHKKTAMLFEGIFINDKIYGEGRMMDDNEMYHGEYVDSLKDGYGIGTTRKGEKLTGQWKKGKIEGKVVYNFLDGSKMEGYHEKG